MVFVGDKKYACETCIKGHRSSSCRHTDRPLFEIKKKGRPVTQCEHCRELRKTRQIHVKCVCEGKDTGEGVSSGKASSKVSARATFPGGLPEELLLEASAATQPFSESDSDHSNSPCACKDSATCTCWTPRARGKRTSKVSSRRGSENAVSAASKGELYSQPAALVVNAHAGNRRPVLPKPPSDRPGSPSRTSHDPSSLQTGRQPSHGQSFFSPYGRAYEQTRPPAPLSMGDASVDLPNYLDRPANQDAQFGEWALGPDGSVFTPTSLPPTCGCGPTCACPGCMEHNGPNIDPSAACSNPNACVACLECNFNSLAALATDTARTVYDSATMQNIDEWLRQVSSMPELPSTSSVQPPPMLAPPSSLSQPDLRFDSTMMDDMNMWNEFLRSQGQTQPPPISSDGLCGGRCNCSPGLCACPSDCGGFLPDLGRTLSFATSGERGGGGQCCGPRHPADIQPSAGPSSSAARVSAPYGDSSWLAATLPIPRTSLSRASSHSSHSSHHSASSSSLDLHDAMPATDMAGGVHACCASMGGLNTSVSPPPPSVSPASPSPVPHLFGSDHNQYRTSSSSGHASPSPLGFSNPNARPF